MATALSSRIASIDQAPSAALRLLSLNFRRLYSTNPPPADSPPSPTDAAKPSRKKHKNLFEVAQFLPSWGVGYHMAKTHWDSVSYEITKINLYKDGRHGKAWGLAYKDGVPVAAPKKISGVHKRCWRYIPNPKKVEQTAADPQVQTA